MTLRSSLFFAKRLLFTKSKETSIGRRSLFASLLCIGMSIVPLIVVITVANGMIEGMSERMIGLSTSHIEALVYYNVDAAKTAKNLRVFAKEIKNENGVVNAFPELDVQALAATASYRTGVQVRSVEKDIFEKNKSFKNFFKIVQGSLTDFEEGKKTILVGKKTAELLSIEVGKTLRIMSASKNANGLLVPAVQSFKVSAIISSGYQELDATWIFVPLEYGFSLVKNSMHDCKVLIETRDAFSSELVSVQRNLQKKFSRTASLYRWDEANQAQYENFSSTKVMLVFIMMLIVLVASINISSALVMFVMEKKREIAILKSIGAHANGIAFSFLLAGGATGFGGLLFGLPLGLLCAVNVNRIIYFFEKVVNVFTNFLYLVSGHESSAHITLLDPSYYLTEIPIVIPFGDVALIALATVFMSLIVSALPAWKAGKEKPLETLRKV